MIEDLAKKWTLGARVTIEFVSDGYRMTRSAAFVYDAPGGFAFVSPSYRDPYGSQAWHAIEATLSIKSDSLVAFAGPRYRGTIEEVGVDDVDLPAEAMNAFAVDLEAAGLTWEGERERLRALI